MASENHLPMPISVSEVQDRMREKLSLHLQGVWETDKKIYAENTARQYLYQLTEMGIVERREISRGHYI